MGEERETNKMQLIWCLLSNFYLNIFPASLCPSSGDKECALPHMVFCTGSVSCGCVELGSELCALWTVETVTFTDHTARVPATHNHSQHYQCRTPYAAVHTLVLLMMGIMMPETCWDRSLIINIRLSLLFHRAFHIYLLICTNECTIFWLNIIQISVFYITTRAPTCFDPLRSSSGSSESSLLSCFQLF